MRGSYEAHSLPAGADGKDKCLPGRAGIRSRSSGRSRLERVVFRRNASCWVTMPLKHGQVPGEREHMFPQCSVFIATSLDGYIAREDGAIDWLEKANKLVPPGEDCGYQVFMSTVDALVMGRNTFDLVTTFPGWPYGATPVAVLSRSLVALPSGLPPSVSLHRESPIELVDHLGKLGHKHLYIDGGLTIQSFLRAGLIGEMIITTVPVLLGSGRRLFGSLEADVELEFMSSRAFPFGFVQSRYRLATGT